MINYRRICAEIALVSLVLFTISTSQHPVAAVAPPSWQMVGQIGGPTSAVAMLGNYAYVGVGLRLVVLDVSDPTSPTEVGSTTPFPYFVEDISVSGTRAYVAAGGAGLRVVDISDPTDPTELGAWDSPGYAEGVTVSENYAYLADGPYGMRVVDISNPAHPAPLRSAYDMNYAFEVAISGHYAYLAAAGAGLLVADISVPSNPSEVGRVDTSGYAYGIAIKGTVAYVADAWDGLLLIDVSDPENPVELGAVTTTGWALNVAIVGSSAYVADGALGLRIIDVSDPDNPVEKGSYETYGLARRLAVDGDIVCIADLRTGLRLVDVTKVTQPVQLGLYSPMADARRTAILGNYAYVAAGFSGLRVIDISDVSRPYEVATYDTEGGYAAAIVLNGEFAYLATFNEGPYNLHILNISDPEHPTRIGEIPFGEGTYRDLALQGNILYVPDEWGLRLIDVSDPTAPTELGFIRLDQNQQATVEVAVSGTLAYVADAMDGVKIVDVSNPHAPILVKTFLPHHAATGVAVTGNKLFVAESGEGLQIADVSKPAEPVQVGFFDTPGIAFSVLISGTEAYVGDSGGGMMVVDVSDPVTPSLASVYDTAGLACHIALTGENVYVSDGTGGLVILERTTVGMPSQLESVYSKPSNPELLDNVEISNQINHPRTPESFNTMLINSNSVSVGFSSGPIQSADTHVVTSALDSGTGTFRQALLDGGPGDTITFDPTVFPPAHPATITLASVLPHITQDNLTIDASNAGVILDGSTLPSGTEGLVIMSNNNTIKGLQILNFPFVGVGVGGQYNQIGGNRLQGNGPIGEGNLISGNGKVDGVSGLTIGGTYNTVIGNLIGTDLGGTFAMSNEGGIGLCCGASHNVIGGTTQGERNIISGNIEGGILMNNIGTDGNVVIGNYIGTDITGTQPLPNGYPGGVAIFDGPIDNIVGGIEPGEANLISGNTNGVMISGIDANHNAIIGNLIGTNSSGTVALGNFVGILLCGAGFNRVEHNVISSSASSGINVCDWGWPHSLIFGNYIGTDISGTQPLGNGNGILSLGNHVFIGGATAAERNVIGDSQGGGIDIEGVGAEYDWLAGNFIGTDISGAIPLGNGWAGVLFDHSGHNFVQGNTIGYNGQQVNAYYNSGVLVSQSRFNTIRRNTIYNSVGKGIFLLDDGNQMLPSPVITNDTRMSLSGTACPGCTVEVFSDVEDEGRVYEDTTIANPAGNWTLNLGHPLTGPHVTATATDHAGNTSEFSAPWVIWGKVYLPFTRR
jgi:parallel beta-helix repeat protein